MGMSMKLQHMYITNDVRIAKVLDELGIELVWLDLEQLGKAERQKGMNSVKSQHTIEDVKKVKTGK